MVYENWCIHFNRQTISDTQIESVKLSAFQQQQKPKEKNKQNVVSET